MLRVLCHAYGSKIVLLLNGYDKAYAICSVAVDLKISQVVDVPNMLVSAFLPEDVFTD